MHQVCYAKRSLLYVGVNAAAGKAIPYVSPSVTQYSSQAGQKKQSQ
jgi:hypothetical protein